ncbi:MAG: hypothetical protein GX175_08290 [Halanaerobiaceae bacterium]|nr:hypothetical protein [Halanaerobiaceae bacterium]
MNKKRFLFLMIILAVFLLIIVYWKNNPSPEKVVTNFFLCLKEGKEEEVKNKVATESIDEVLDVFTNINIFEDDLLLRIFSEQYSFTVLDTEKDGRNALVRLSISFPDQEEVTNSYINERQKVIYSYLLDEIDENQLKQRNEDIILDIFKKAEISDWDAGVYLQHLEGEWKITDWDFDYSMEFFAKEFIEKYRNLIITEPEEVIVRFWYKLRNQDIDSANKHIYPGREEIAMEFFDPEEFQEYLGKLSPEFMSEFDNKIYLAACGTEINNEGEAVVDILLTVPDLEKAFDMLAEEFAEILFDYIILGLDESEIEKRLDRAGTRIFRYVDTVSFREKAYLSKYDGVWKIYDWNFDNYKNSFMNWIESLED